jgi:outer membrane protein insertion porin family
MTLATLLVFFSSIALAQTQSFPIVSLTVDGNKIYTDDQILAITGLKIGMPVDQKAFEKARDLLTNSGFFESVGYKYAPSADKAGYAASFQVVEVEQSYPVAFERLKPPSQQLIAALKKSDPLFGERIPGTAPVLARYAKLLEPAAGEQVVGKVMPSDSGELRVVFQPARMPPSVAEVRFIKNNVIPSTALQNAIAGAAIGAVWDEKRFAQILEASIRPLYEARGRIRVAFPKISTEPVQDVEGLRVNVEVSEGDTFTLGEVAIQTEAAPQRELAKAADLKSGDIANFDEINKGVERMQAVVRRNGYLKAKPNVERKIDDAKKVVNLLITIDPGKRFQFSRLEIKGLDIISEPVIRKMWTMKPGEPFNP